MFAVINGGNPVTENTEQFNLFGDTVNANECITGISENDIALVTGLHSDAGIDFSDFPPYIHSLYELSANAFDVIVHAWMSELPVTEEIIRFGRKILQAASGNYSPGMNESEQRQESEKAATDRCDPDVQTVQAAAYKVWHEIHRMTGLLRFSPDENGVYTALCEPDHFILPALGNHFHMRFGITPWAIIDVKRRFCLESGAGEAPEFLVFCGQAETGENTGAEWENLWRNYHKTINNESRNNPELQLKFMPKRYWKYLNEL